MSRSALSWAGLLFGLSVACTAQDGADEGCEPDDLDGIAGGDYTFEVEVDDDAFTPVILTTQNTSRVTLTLTNAGSVPHGFVVDCLPTRNDLGCPQESCFDEAATIAPLAPGASRRIEFPTPTPEGLYTFRSGTGADAPTGQFIIR